MLPNHWVFCENPITGGVLDIVGHLVRRSDFGGDTTQITWNILTVRKMVSWFCGWRPKIHMRLGLNFKMGVDGDEKTKNVEGFSAHQLKIEWYVLNKFKNQLTVVMRVQKSVRVNLWQCWNLTSGWSWCPECVFWGCYFK